MFINVLVIFCNVVVHILQPTSNSDAPGADLGRDDVGMAILIFWYVIIVKQKYHDHHDY